MTSAAKFLVLIDDVPRALLFDAAQQLLGEVIEDDDYIVDQLLDGATACPIPNARMLEAMVPAPAQPVRCFELR